MEILRLAAGILTAAALVRLTAIRVHRTYPALYLYLLAYLLTRAIPPHYTDATWWSSTWAWIAAVLLPLRAFLLAEVAFFVSLEVPERRPLAAGLAALAGALVGILCLFQPIGFDFAGFIAVRQYLQVAMACFALFGALYLWVRPVHMAQNTKRYGLILLILLLDYAVASAFDAHAGLASPFVTITGHLWREVRTISTLIALACIAAWGALLRPAPPFWTRATLDVLRRRDPLSRASTPRAEFGGHDPQAWHHAPAAWHRALPGSARDLR